MNESEPPAPPPVPPQPPSPEILRPAAAHVPLTPIMDFLQRRLEALEGQLAAERERAQSAQAALAHQDSLRNEVEDSLKSLRDQLRREKTEREAEGEKLHSRGRIEALEKRLDEMHRSWVELLKETVGRHDGKDAEKAAAQAAVGREISAVAEELRALKAGWEAQRADLAAETAARAAAGERRQAQDSARAQEQLAELGRERAALQKKWEEASGAARQEYLQERLARENAVSAGFAELGRRLDAMGAEERQTAASAVEIKAGLAKLAALLQTPPQAKDEIIVALEREKSDLLKALQDRADALARVMAERREAEQSLSAGMMDLHSRLDAERDRGRQLQGRVSELGIDVKAAQDRAELAARACAEHDKLAATLASERDELAGRLAAEAEKARAREAASAKAEAESAARLEATQRRLEEALARGSELSEIVAELRSRTATLSEHMARALQEKDAAVSRFGAWGQEREKLLAAIHEKDEMISLLSATFQGIMKKG